MEIDWTKVDALAGGLSKDELFSEALFALGGQYFYYGLNLPAPTAGSFILLEILQNSYITDEEVSDYDVDEAVYVLSMGRDVLSAVFEDKLFDNPIKERVEDFTKSIPNYNRIHFRIFLSTYFKYCLNGFKMIPGGDGEPKKMTFDADWLAGYVSICHQITGYDMDRITWEMPITMGGFCIVRYARENGQKNIERPSNIKAQLEEIKRQMEQIDG